MRFKPKKIMIIGFILMAIFGIGFVVMWLWNALLPDIFGLKTITYWQAIGLLILSKIFFGGFGFRGRHNGKAQFANGRFKEKLMNMSEEEKIAFKKQWRERCRK